MRPIALLVACLLPCWPAAAATPEPCPDLFVPFSDSVEPVTCQCSPKAVQTGMVWGTDIYSSDSSICRAALHAGLIGRAGGSVTASPGPSQRSYRGSNRNGVTSNAYGAWDWSFSFAREPATAKAVSPPSPGAPAAAPQSRVTAAETPLPQPGELRVTAIETKPGAAIATPPLPVRPGSRVALVIGNGAYSGRLSALANPPNDARDMAASLTALGFDVTLAVDARRQEMEDKLATFAKAARTAEVALAFYAGHGLQHQGVNYLAPVDATLDDETDLRRRFVKVQDLVEELQSAKGIRILLIDACRDNTAIRQLEALLPRSRSAGVRQGLAAEKAEGILIAFATQADRIAHDGGGRNSPYTEALLRHLPTQGQEIRTMLTRVRSDVLRTTGGTQRPEVSDSLDGEFAFR